MCSSLGNSIDTFQSQKSFCIQARRHRLLWFECSSLFFSLRWQIGYWEPSSSRMSRCSCQNCSPMMSQWWSCTLLLLRVTGTSFSSSFGRLRRLVTVSSRWTKTFRRVNEESKEKKKTTYIFTYMAKTFYTIEMEECALSTTNNYKL